MSASPVSGLLFRRRPAAIPRLIVAVVVDAIYLHAWWHWSHICQKAFKLLPSLTNLDSASTVILILRRVWIGASRLYSGPATIFARISSSCGVAMRYFCRNLSVETSAAFCFSRSQIACADGHNASACAGALPHRAIYPVSFQSFGVACNGKPAEHPPNAVYFC